MKTNLRTRAALTTSLMMGSITLLSPSVALSQSISVGTYTGYHGNTQGSGSNTVLNINGTYRCTEGTCFTATMTFPNSGYFETDIATGHFSGTNFTLRRYIRPLNYVQTWNGITSTTGVSGNWFTDPEPFNRGVFNLNR
ncbi:hypothetical protein LC605_06665 [Nostoc sp. CHAB 5836]|uniref:hypothetical protein n=1 Tax=Nostoc sp. CHAB 5836 TaxID=2780404 RepID=UPI001E51DD2A|nr:hypothetical protein [Nostoc sp. CHAB 5836]MCC5614758.1 hypothetical protein [Nostoc sp. CHAB 5836]